MEPLGTSAVMHWKKMFFILALSCLKTSCKSKQGSITHELEWQIVQTGILFLKCFYLQSDNNHIVNFAQYNTYFVLAKGQI